MLTSHHESQIHFPPARTAVDDRMSHNRGGPAVSPHTTSRDGDKEAETEPWGDAPTDEATIFFQETLGDWQCHDCCTGFTVDTALDVARQIGCSVSCPVCGGDNIVRRGDL